MFFKNYLFINFPLGKSAIAAGIQLCLGSTARTTGRGSNQKEYIREGSPGPAIVRLTLVNEGTDAYEPNIYGNRISIERRISRNSGGGYHILDSKGVEITKQKGELEKILRNFNILVDNPCCILTQEESKKFVHGKSDAKYEFFLKATGLYQLKENLLEVHQAIEEAKEIAATQNQKIELKEKSVAELKRMLDRLIKLDDLENDIKLNEAKMKWIDVNILRSEIANREKEVSKKDDLYDKLEEDIIAASSDQTNVNEEMERMNEEMNAIQVHLDEVSSDIDNRQAAVVEISRQVNYIKSQLTNANSTKKNYESRLRGVNNEISTYRQKAKSDAKNEELELLQSIEQIDNQIEEIKKAEDVLKVEKMQNTHNLQNVRTEINNCSSHIHHLQNKINNTRDEINSLSGGGENSRAALLGQDMVRAINEIRTQVQQRRFRGPVSGPIALSVSIKEGLQKWSQALERALGQLLRSFVVTSMEDRALLYDILQRNRCSHNSLIITQNSSARYNINEALSNDSLTVLQALNIADDAVYNAIVDQGSVDRILLAHSEEEILQKFVTRVNQRGKFIDELKYDASQAITLDATIVKYMYGNQSSEVNRFPFKNFLSSDTKSLIENAKVSLNESTVELENAKRTLADIQANSRAMSEAVQDIERKLNELSRTKNDLFREKGIKEAALQEIQSSENDHLMITSLEEEKNELEHALQVIQNQITDFQGNLQTLEGEMRIRSQAKQEAENKRRGYMNDISNVERRLLDIVELRNSSKKLLDVKKAEMDSTLRSLDALKQDIGELNESLSEKVVIARNVSREYFALKTKKASSLTIAGKKRGLSSSSNSENAKKKSGHKKLNLEDDEDFGIKTENPNNEKENNIESLNNLSDNTEELNDEDLEIPLAKDDTKVKLDNTIRRLREEIREGKRQANLAGYSLELLQDRYKRAFDEYSALKHNLARLNQNVEDLTQDEKDRRSKWLSALKRSTKVTTAKFDNYVQAKGSTGVVKFDHSSHTLDLSYQVDNSDKQTEPTDVRNLSGGERSFVTFSLQLALGHVVSISNSYTLNYFNCLIIYCYILKSD